MCEFYLICRLSSQKYKSSSEEKQGVNQAACFPEFNPQQSSVALAAAAPYVIGSCVWQWSTDCHKQLCNWRHAVVRGLLSFEIKAELWLRLLLGSGSMKTKWEAFLCGRPKETLIPSDIKNSLSLLSRLSVLILLTILTLLINGRHRFRWA